MTVDEWDHREVCPDGSCVGVIGPEGRCKVCDRVSPAWNNERERGLISTDTSATDDEDDADSEDEDDDELDDGGDDDEAAAPADPDRLAALAPDADAGDYEWSRRVLCPDGACVGVIGPDRVCTVCGKSAT
jgi:hypothetical protein